MRRGVQVTIFNQRSVEEIFSMLYQVAAMVGRADEGLRQLEAMRAPAGDRGRGKGAAGGRVFFEEWDEPHISAIRWVSELVGIAGGDDVFPGSRAAAGQAPHHRGRRRDRAAQSGHRDRLLVRQEVPA